MENLILEPKLKIPKKEFMEDEVNEKGEIITETGISHDYANKVNALFCFYKEYGLDGLKEYVKENPVHIEKYEEVYSGNVNLINDKNREGLKNLSEQVDQINEILKNPDSIDENVFKKTLDQIYYLIYGDRHIEI